MQKISLIVFLSLLISACGGGSSSNKLNIEQDSIEFKGQIGKSTPRSKTVRGSVSDVKEGVHIRVDIGNSELVADARAYFTGGYSAELEITPKSTALLEEGVYRENITISVCYDTACRKHISGSPKKVEIVYLVEDNRMQVSSTELANGSILETKSAYHCDSTCTEKVTSSDNLVEFIALPNPGYELNSWSGACTGSDNCQVTNQEKTHIELNATFTKSVKTFETCPIQTLVNSTQLENNEEEPEVNIITSGSDHFWVSNNTESVHFTQIIPLCGGLVLGLDVNLDQIFIRDVVQKNTIDIFSFDTNIHKMAYDSANSLLYISHINSPDLTRLDLVSKQRATIELPNNINDLIVTTDNLLFVDHQDYSKGALSIFDSKTLELKYQQHLGDEIRLMSFDPVKSRLYISNGTRLKAYSYNRSINTLSLSHYVATDNVQGNCKEIMISNDGEHIAIPCGGGNGVDYSVFDFKADGTNEKLGEWETGAYPTSGQFTASGETVLLSDNNSFQLYNILDHNLIYSFTPQPVGCYSSMTRVKLSTDGSLILGLYNCGSHSSVAWHKYDTSN
ncbi:YncE family protein [Catenovulum sp. SX2]|uniref:YncE family protein n=1 Tax=Catenovulum sp. SX2 TaxID=3398614 RepID=UPI003F84A8BA